MPCSGGAYFKLLAASADQERTLMRGSGGGHAPQGSGQGKSDCGWSLRHSRRQRLWLSHVERDLQREDLVGRALKHMDSAWQRQRRLAMGSVETGAGRLGSRSYTHVFPRWEDTLS